MRRFVFSVIYLKPHFLMVFLSVFISHVNALTSEEIIDADTSIDNSHQENEVLGANLFNGSFATQKFSGFNPNYRISVGDKILIQVWGAVEVKEEQVVDAQGNIFLPQVGPVNVLGVLNSELNESVTLAISRIYKKDVFTYSNLISSQPVKIFVAGNVKNPGLYSGLSSESILSYLDRAGGIDPSRGSFLNVQLKRNSSVIETFNLYKFLLNGDMPHRQLHEGDVIFVGSRQNSIKFSGLFENPFEIEFEDPTIYLEDALSVARPLPSATHLVIQRNQGLVKEVEYIEVSSQKDDDTVLMSGDSVNAVSDKIQGSIGVQVQGEHLGQSQYVLSYGSNLSELLPKLRLSEHSELSSLQLFRPSLAEKQKEAILRTLEILQSQVLSARSETAEEANLRAKEAESIMLFIDKAKMVTPKGQVILDGNSSDDVILENGDILVIPKKSNLVRVSGEVLFANSVIYQKSFSAIDYIEIAGGFTQDRKKSRVILRRANGATFEMKTKNSFFKKDSFVINPGDEIMVLPDVDNKSFQHAKEVFQIIYQLALSAGVVLKI